MKSIKTICSLYARPFAVCLAILLAGYVLLGQGNDSRFQAEASMQAYSLDMERYVEIGRVIVFGLSPPVPGKKSIGKGQCSLCHTFQEGETIERCPNLFGVERRSRARINEGYYLSEPILIGETDKESGIVKGRPDLIPEEYRREGSPKMTGEDYLRESLMCPSCYVVEGYGKAGGTKSPMPMIHRSPLGLGWVEVNAVIAWLQAKDTPGDYSRVTVPLPTGELAEKKYEIQKKREELAMKTCDNPECVPMMINHLGCPLCHTIPGVPGAVGELGPPLHQRTDAPRRIRDPFYKGKARTAREYIKESILNPDIYIVFNESAGELYPDRVMPNDFGTKLSEKQLELLVNFISNTEPEQSNRQSPR